MTTTDFRTARVLEGLLYCHACEHALQIILSEDKNSFYDCPTCIAESALPSITCDRLDSAILSEITSTIMTDSNIELLGQALADVGSQLPEHAPQALRQPTAHLSSLHAIAINPDTYTTAANIAPAKDFFAKVIDRIDVSRHRAVIHYAVPLPHDSGMPRSVRQSIELPEDTE